MMFPNAHIQKIVILNNCHLSIIKTPETKIGEILKQIDVLILATEFEFGSSRTLWSSVAPSKYVPDSCFGKTGITRNRFDDIWAYI